MGHYKSTWLTSWTLAWQCVSLPCIAILLLLFIGTSLQGLLVYSILQIMGQLHRLNSELMDQQVAPPHNLYSVAICNPLFSQRPFHFHCSISRTNTISTLGYSESYKPTLPNIKEVRKVLLNGPTIMNKSNWLTVKQISWWNEMVVWLLGNQIVKLWYRATEVYWYALTWYQGNLAGYKATQPHHKGNKV